MHSKRLRHSTSFPLYSDTPKTSLESSILDLAQADISHCPAKGMHFETYRDLSWNISKWKSPKFFFQFRKSFAEEHYYANMIEQGNYIKMGWLTKLGQTRKSWKLRFFVLFTDGTLAYYKKRKRVKMRGHLKLNDGIVGIQYIDMRMTGKPYAFQIKKGFFTLTCHAQTQLEAEIWVHSLRSIRELAPIGRSEIELTAPEEKVESVAIARHLNKIFVTSNEIVSSLRGLKARVKRISHDRMAVLNMLQSMIVKLETAVIDQYHSDLYEDPGLELLPGIELMKLVRRHIEDRVFTAHCKSLYSSMDSCEVNEMREIMERNREILQENHEMKDFGLPEELSASCNWEPMMMAISALDRVSLPSHKLELIILAGKEASNCVARVHGCFSTMMESTLCAMFRYAIVFSSVHDLALLRILIKATYKSHPVCVATVSTIKIFLRALKWISVYEPHEQKESRETLVLMEKSRSIVHISTMEIGIQLTPDTNGRGAVVYNVRRQSQAALSLAIDTGLALVAINDKPVILMPFQKVCKSLRRASLPKRLTFFSEDYYNQLLELDVRLLPYLMCLAAGRGDIDSLQWLHSKDVDVNAQTDWESTCGKQVFSFTPESGHGSPLLSASLHGQYEAVNFLLSRGADPAIRNAKGETPLHIVGKSADTARIIQKLIEYGALVDAVDDRGYTSLMTMCEKELYEGAVTMSALRSSVNHVAWSNGFTALIVSAQIGSRALVDLCLCRGADVNMSTLDKETALHMSARRANASLIAQLLAYRANANVVNRFGQTPAAVLISCSATKNTSLEDVVMCFRKLADAGCDLKETDMFGRDVRHLVLCENVYWRKAFHTILFADTQRAGDQALFDASDCDIFASYIEDYCSNDSHLKLLHQKPEEHWRDILAFGTKSLTGSSMCLYASVETLMRTFFACPSTDLCEMLCFILFIDTLCSMDQILELMTKYSLIETRLPGFLYFAVMLLAFKFRTSPESNRIWCHIITAISKHYQLSCESSVQILAKYVGKISQCFVLHDHCVISVVYRKVREHVTGSDILFCPESVLRDLASHIEPKVFAEHCTLIAHAIFTEIPVEDYFRSGTNCMRSTFFQFAKCWFQHLQALVINVILCQPTPKERAKSVCYFLLVAKQCLILRNFDSLAAVLYAIQSTAIQRLRKTMACLDEASLQSMYTLQSLSDKGCREMNCLMREASLPSMPYVGLYLQSFVSLNEIPIMTEEKNINRQRLLKCGELAIDIIRKKAVPYALPFDPKVDASIRVILPFDNEESRYSKSMELEPKEESSSTRHVRPPSLESDTAERDSEGSRFRQWFRKKTVMRIVRSRRTSHFMLEWV